MRAGADGRTAGMSERAILFSAPMVRALIEGRKTQTRRLVKIDAAGRAQHAGRNWHLQDPDCVAACPHGQPGTLLWVREAFCFEHETEGNDPPHTDGRPIEINIDAFDGQPAWIQPHYRATDPEPELAYEYGTCPRCAAGLPHAHWKPSIHMPRWASRITLRITYVRVDRVQNITPDDAAAEGVQIPANADTGNPLLDIGSPYCPGRYLTPAQAQHFDQPAWLRAHFASAWDSLYAKRGYGWDTDPFVWVLEFEVLLGPWATGEAP